MGDSSHARDAATRIRIHLTRVAEGTVLRTIEHGNLFESFWYSRAQSSFMS